MKSFLRLFFTGFTMSAVDMLPGISSGTIAFLLGVSEELLFAITTITGPVPKLIFQGKLKQAWQLTPFHFLLPLGLGSLTALATMAGLLSRLLALYPQQLWAFFCGLLLASIFSVRKRVVKWGGADVCGVILAAVFTFFLVGIVPSKTSSHPLAFVGAGAVTVIASLLPGVSGSYLLVIMGKYEQVLQALVVRDFFILGLMSLGTVIGMIILSRILKWLFSYHHDLTVAVLTGFMIGALRKIWPWPKTVLPMELNIQTLILVLLILLGIAFVLLLNKLQLTQEQTEDLPQSQFKKQHQRAIVKAES